MCMCTASTVLEVKMGSKKTRNRDRVEPPAYLADVLALASQVKPGTIATINVHHDSICDLLNHRGPCNCTPDTKLVRPS